MHANLSHDLSSIIKEFKVSEATIAACKHKCSMIHFRNAVYLIMRCALPMD